MSSTLWPNFAGLAAPRSMQVMLYDAAGDIKQQESGALDFYVDTIGVGTSGAIHNIRYNCYLKVVKKDYMHLLFQVTTPVASPFPATVVTAEGDDYPDLQDEQALRTAIAAILQRPRTTEVVLYLLNTAR